MCNARAERLLVHIHTDVRLRNCCTFVGPFGQEEDTMNTYRTIVGMVALGALCVSGACSRESQSDATTTAAETNAAVTDRTAELQRERDEVMRDLQERITEIEQDYAEGRAEVAKGAREATAGLREELKEDMTNVKGAVAALGSTTPENWWDRHEEAIEGTADDIEADVRRIAGNIMPARKDASTGTAGENIDTAPFASRRDRFVADLRARVEAMENALEKVNARGARETELEDTRARVKKLGEDVDRLASASADDWWELSKNRVTEYVDRVEASVDRLDDDKPRQQ
jgi:hypothetical protein